MAMLRTFIALDMPAEAKDALRQLQANWQRLAEKRGLAIDDAVKWVLPDGVHLTLKFLGATEEALVPEIERALQTAVGNTPVLHLQLTAAGAFPSARQPRVLWVGMAGDERLVQELQQRVEQNVSPLGFPSERRPFSPHLTLARVRERASPQARRALAELVSSLPPVPRVTFAATGVSLMKSELRPSGARYEAIFTVQLGT